MYVIPFYKVENSKPENLRRLAKFLGIKEDLPHEVLVGEVCEELMRVPVKVKSSAQRQAYEDFWAKQPTT